MDEDRDHAAGAFESPEIRAAAEEFIRARTRLFDAVNKYNREARGDQQGDVVWVDVHASAPNTLILPT